MNPMKTKIKRTTVPLDFKFDTNRQKMLSTRGADRTCFAAAREAFLLEDSLMKIKPKLDRMIVTSAITVKQQVSALERLFAHPLHGSPIIGIGSFPTDMRAKMLAINLMNRAVDVQLTRDRKTASHFPLWHKVYGGFGDPLIDNKQNMSMLIISNVGVDSTAAKIEKVRDLIERYDNIPRVIVTHGTDPLSFFLTKLHVPMTYGFYLGADSKSVVLDI